MTAFKNLYILKMKPTVLVVDDSLTNIVLIEAILKREKLNVIKAFSVDESLKVLDREKIDLIILDIMFPGKDGRDFLRQRNDLAQISSIPVIITSAISNENEIEEIMKLKADYYFKKPLEIELFLNKVKEYTVSNR
jgi:response regulator RpfG family c-di-GMP phosphodiesterase